MSAQKEVQGGDAQPLDLDTEASVVCGGVALAGSRRVVHSFRCTVSCAFAAQAAVGISTMVMSVILLCFMVDRVSDGLEAFGEAQGQWAAAFTLVTVHLILQPFMYILLLLVPCRSRPRLYRTVWCLISMSFQLDINAFIQIMIWRVNQYATCAWLDQGADDMLCSDAQGTGTATAVMVILCQGLLDWWYLKLLHRAQPLSDDPVIREVLARDSQTTQKHVRVVRWLLAEASSDKSCCGKSSRAQAPPEATYEHKRKDVELQQGQASPDRSRRGSNDTLPPYHPRDFGTLSAPEVQG